MEEPTGSERASEEGKVPDTSPSSCVTAGRALLALCAACLLAIGERLINVSAFYGLSDLIADRFVRETVPMVVDLGVADPDPGGPLSTGVVILPASAAGEPTMSYIKIPKVRMADLPNVAEFSQLFNNYKIDKIETVLVPMWQQMTQQPITPSDAVWTHTATIPNLMMTRVNTKWLITGLPASATAAAQRKQLAEIQKKSRSLYGNKKWLKLSTSNPHVPIDISDGAAGTNIGIYQAPWLQFNTAADQQFESNNIYFADRLDGTNMVPGVYKYRMYHRVHFRTSFVG